MWTREELKTRGKAAFLRNYWICVVAALILTLLVGSGTSNSGNSNNDSHQTNSVGISGFYRQTASHPADRDIRFPHPGSARAWTEYRKR